MTLRIEPMELGHLEAVCEIDQAVYSNPWGHGTWRHELTSHDRYHLVAFDDERLIGHAGLLFLVDEAHVITVAVSPEDESCGVATRLLIKLLEEARRRGSLSATLEVRSASQRPQRLYGRFGFRPVGVRKNYYSTPKDDGIVMWLDELQDEQTSKRIESIAAEHPPTEVR